MFEKILNSLVLKNFFKVELTSGEREIAIASVKHKYAKAFRRAFFYCLAAIFPILFLETQVLISVLIPITMVAGTAWFSISLANMKQKFENFGLELTTNLFEAFTISLGLLLMLSVFSLWDIYTTDFISNIQNIEQLQFIAFIAGIFIVWNIIYKIFIGSIQYDINDAMLSGQNEAAERFFRKSLSILHSLADWLRWKQSLQVSNYYIWVAFFEIFSHLETFLLTHLNTKKHIEAANILIQNPSMSQKDADEIAMNLIQDFLKLCINPQWHSTKKSIQAIYDEVHALEHNNNENQEMIDTRLWVVFTEIANLLESQGETLFKK
jgi:hypothetical protein